jgi:2-polyprenyl-3-methyl-5-hydroxy-6-metoxy-1,4-benzoquinol methylase
MCGSETSTHTVLGKRLNRSQGKNPKGKIGITTTIAKCCHCGLIYSNPQPVPYDLQDHYGVTPEDYWKESYFQMREDHFQGELKRIHQLIDFRKGMKSLDIGAGLGKTMVALRDAGFDAYGFEPSPQFYERVVSKLGIGRDKLKLAMMENAEYANDTFDFITFGAVLEHLYDPSEAIIKAMTWLKPNGLMHIEVPSSDWLMNKLINAFYRLKQTDYVGNISPMHNPFHLYEFGLKSFHEHSMKNRYDVAFHEYYVCPTNMPKVVDYVLRKLMKRTGTGMQLCVWLIKK